MFGQVSAQRSNLLLKFIHNQIVLDWWPGKHSKWSWLWWIYVDTIPIKVLAKFHDIWISRWSTMSIRGIQLQCDKMQHLPFWVSITIFGSTDLNASNCTVILLFFMIFSWFLNHNLIWYWLSIAFLSRHGGPTLQSNIWILNISVHLLHPILASYESPQC